MPPTRGYTVNTPATAAPVAFTGTFNNAAQASGPLNRAPMLTPAGNCWATPTPAPWTGAP